MSRHDLTDTGAPAVNPVASYLLAITLALLAAAALVHWLACSQEAGTALCTLLATRHARWRWLDRLVATLRAVGLRHALRWEEAALDDMLAAERDLPELIRQQRRRVDHVRGASIVAASVARGDA